MRKRKSISNSNTPKIPVEASQSEQVKSIKAFASMSEENGGLSALQQLLKESSTEQSKKDKPQPKLKWVDIATPKQELKKQAKEEKKKYIEPENDFSSDSNSDSYSDYSYSSYSSDDVPQSNGSTKKNDDIMKLLMKIDDIQMKISYNSSESHNDTNYEMQLYEYEKKLNDLREKLEESNRSVTEVIFDDELFFTELFDFFQNTPRDLSSVNQEFLDPILVMERIKKYKTLDPDQYKNSGLGRNSGEILAFFADIEFREWGFLIREPLIDMKWIQAGWMWLDDDGDSNLVPKIFDDFIPQLVDKLKESFCVCEDDFYTVFAHVIEIIDYCLHPSVAESKLKPVFLGLVKRALDKRIINTKQYHSILDRCGFK